MTAYICRECTVFGVPDPCLLIVHDAELPPASCPYLDAESYKGIKPNWVGVDLEDLILRDWSE